MRFILVREKFRVKPVNIFRPLATPIILFRPNRAVLQVRLFFRIVPFVRAAKLLIARFICLR